MRPVARLGLALEPWDGLAAWAAAASLDAVFLHRPWGLAPGALPPGTGLLASHRPFDERLTTGFNPALAARLGMTGLEPLGERDGRPLGMTGAVEPQRFAAFLARVREELGGVEASAPPRGGEVARVAAANAMTDALVREAAGRGADVYLTGQLRAPTRAAVAETGIGVVATGHRRAEEWGLRELARLLRARWPGLATEVWPHP
ncbi:MAG TPA: Nif3-like dinuclear metal center hexameric protein [Longimicrobiaceae bacterium]